MADDSSTLVNSRAEYHALQMTYSIHSDNWVISILQVQL